jgi:chemotaxis protein CheD
MKINIGISELFICDDPTATLVTHGLGSCVGVTAYDPIRKIGAMLHYLLPLSGEKAGSIQFNPFQFGDSGLEAMFNALAQKGCRKEDLRITIAGGASMSKSPETDHFQIGKRNITVARKTFWRYNILISAEHVEMSTGKTYITSQGVRVDL